PRGWRPSTIYGTRAAGCSFLLEVRRVNTHPPRLVFQLLSRLVLRGHDEERLRLLVDPREHLRDFLLHQPVRQLLDEQLPDGLVRHVGPSRDALHALDDECAGTGIDDLAQLAVLELEGDLLNLGRPGPGVSADRIHLAAPCSQVTVELIAGRVVERIVALANRVVPLEGLVLLALGPKNDPAHALLAIQVLIDLLQLVFLQLDRPLAHRLEYEPRLDHVLAPLLDRLLVFLLQDDFDELLLVHTELAAVLIDNRVNLLRGHDDVPLGGRHLDDPAVDVQPDAVLAELVDQVLAEFLSGDRGGAVDVGDHPLVAGSGRWARRGRPGGRDDALARRLGREGVRPELAEEVADAKEGRGAHERSKPARKRTHGKGPPSRKKIVAT